MDLLDNITSLITNSEKERKPKQKNTVEARGLAAPSTSTNVSYSLQTNVDIPHSSGLKNVTKDRCDFIIPRKLQIEMNGVNMDLSNAPDFVTRYRIDITKIMHEKEKDATRGPKGDFATQQRRRSLFSLFTQLVAENPTYFGEDDTKHVYDLGNTFYSIGCKITEEDGQVVFKMKPDEIRCPFTRKIFSDRCRRLVFTVHCAGQVFIKSFKQSEDAGELREANRFFEVLTSQSLYHSSNHVFANKFYEASDDKDVKLGDGKCIKSGFEKNVRFLGEHGENATAILQVDPKKSAFYCPQPVLSFIREHADGLNPEDALKQRAFQKRIARDLRDLVVTTTHMDRNKRFYIHGITENNAKNQFFETTRGEISIEQYFEEKYKVALRYPYLPLAVERISTTGFNFYPLEVLSIEPGQRVGGRKLEGRLTDKMIQQSRMLPHEVRDHSVQQLAHANLISGENRYLASFGVRISRGFVTTEAKVLTAPEIKYKADSLQPDRSGRLTWELSHGMEFYRPATIGALSVAVFDRAIKNIEALEFHQALVRASRARGMTVQDTNVKVDQLMSELESPIEEYFRSKAGKVSMIIFVTKMKKDPVHDFIKLLEAKHGVLTQHVCAATVLACCRNRTKILENVLLKFNVKNGGVNHIVSSARAGLGNRTSDQDMNGRLFNGKMFVGFELSHAAAQSLYDRQNEVAVKEPTVVGFAYSKGLPTDYAGHWWYQQPRLHKIEYIKNYFHVAFTNYHETNKRLPAEIVVYRSGLSEGDFPKVEDETNDIRAVAEKMRYLNNGKPYIPRITVIVVQTRSNYRIIPAAMVPPRYSLKAAELNVPSGTCADTDIVNPNFREFIMTSQQAISGTSRPVRYTIVVEDQPHRPIYEAEHMTHFLCYGHQQSVLPTHVPAVLYAAENLAKRGRASWKTKFGWNFDDGSSTSALQTAIAKAESPEDFYVRISKELMNSLSNQYFA